MIKNPFPAFFSWVVAFLFTTHADAQTIDSKALARKYAITLDKPAVDFFEGALLGNGGMGVVVNTRPDAVEFHFGHNNVWDIRVAEKHKDKIGTFRKVFEQARTIPAEYKKISDDAAFGKYMELMGENYAKPYPRPMPCGTLILGFDRRKTELLGHKLDIANGLCEVYLVNQGKKAVLQVFTDMEADQLLFRLVDESGKSMPSFFDWLRLMPDPQTPKDIPKYQIISNTPAHVLSFRQVLPYLQPEGYDSVSGHAKDKAFRLSVQLSNTLLTGDRQDWHGNMRSIGELERYVQPDTTAFVGIVKLEEGLASAIAASLPLADQPTVNHFVKTQRASEKIWDEYWNKSAVAVSDELLEATWYRNLYFFNCAVKPGVTCPGLFANWMYGDIGTAWHGDYHMNYNTQQPFWLAFSSNHADKNLAYTDLVHHILPVSQKWAKEYYGMSGAFFPHSAYPVEMTVMPFPVPDWGWEICETPWTVQGLWWHYVYTQDKAYLKERAYVPIREAVRFLVDYLSRPDAHGKQWGDDKYHVFPTCAPELYSLAPGFKYNFDCNVDLTLIKFVFNAYLQASKVLALENREASTIASVKKILAHYPEYTIKKSAYGDVIVGVPNETVDVVYNTPNTLASVFPGEEHGIHSPKATYDILVNTYRNHQNEGGNELVFLNLQAARLGILDLEKFKRQINYCLLPNGTCTDMILQAHGRYHDGSFNWMARMGIWFENFALPVVLNECLMQSYNGTISLFPNWPKSKDAAFQTLRAAGAFLVSSSLEKGEVQWIEIASEAGGVVTLNLPWETGKRILINEKKMEVASSLFQYKMKKGERIRLALTQ